jgi:hypothetical protein
VCCVRQQSDVARALDGFCQFALLPGGKPGDAPRRHFAAFLDELLQELDVLVINIINSFRCQFGSAPPPTAGTPTAPIAIASVVPVSSVKSVVSVIISHNSLSPFLKNWFLKLFLNCDAKKTA